MENDIKYRVTKHDWYEEGEINPGSTFYEVQRYKKFLWWNYWKAVSKPDYDSRSPVRFKTMEDALSFIKKLREGNPAYGWKSKVVLSDPEFQKID